MPFDSLPITSPVIEKLRIGRALIKARGLARGTFQDRDGRVCAVGAITSQGYAEATIQALIYLGRATPDRSAGIADWNDHAGRTEADVIAAYDRAIDLAIADQLNG